MAQVTHLVRVWLRLRVGVRVRGRLAQVTHLVGVRVRAKGTVRVRVSGSRLAVSG